MERLRPRDDAGFVSRLVLFVLVSMLCGLLVAGITLPILGGVGLVARDSANGFESLPAELEIPPLPDGAYRVTVLGSGMIEPVADVFAVVSAAAVERDADELGRLDQER